VYSTKKNSDNKSNETNAMYASQESKENSAKAIVEARMFQSIVDRAVEDYAKDGGFDILPGKGKPLVIPEGDILNSILKNANLLPPWIEMRKEIINDMKIIIEHLDLSENLVQEEHIEAVNQKIRKFNRQVPVSHFQKGLISLQTIRTQYEKWL
jgi:uncharacterized protein YlzI (FlbEa/FlbD family)